MNGSAFMNRLLRPACKECGGAVEWGPPGDLLGRPGVDPEFAAEFVGSEFATWDAWWCPSCSAGGVVSPPQWG